MVFAFKWSSFSEETETQNPKTAYRSPSSAFLPFRPKTAACLVSSLPYSENQGVCLVEKKALPAQPSGAGGARRPRLRHAISHAGGSWVGSPLGSIPMGLLTLEFRNTNVSFSTSQYYCHFVGTLRKIINTKV